MNPVAFKQGQLPMHRHGRMTVASILGEMISTPRPVAPDPQPAPAGAARARQDAEH